MQKLNGSIRGIDLFCGAGGSSWGATEAGVEVLAGFDMWHLAGQVFSNNFPLAKFCPGKLEEADVNVLSQQLGKVDILLASPECTNHSPAKGNKERSEASRMTAFQVIRFAKMFEPRWVVIENVVNIKGWDKYGEFINALQNELGYQVREQVLDASLFGVPQARKRLFLLCDREQMPSAVLTSKGQLKQAKDVIDMNGTYQVSRLDKPGRAAATLQRAQNAINALGPNQPFLVVYYGSDSSGGWQKLDAPLRTITTLDRFALVKPSEEGHLMRMLQVPELKAAMGFPAKFRLLQGTRRQQIHLLGNAVCPPVMRAVVKTLLKN
jgi:DNA (cytosine-5)-methyltransferase 1